PNRPHFVDPEVAAARWIARVAAPNEPIYADAFGAYLIEMTAGYFLPLKGSNQVTTSVPPGGYLFLGSDNVREGVIRLDDSNRPRLNVTTVPLNMLSFRYQVMSMDLIYDNGYAKIYSP